MTTMDTRTGAAVGGRGSNAGLRAFDPRRVDLLSEDGTLALSARLVDVNVAGGGGVEALSRPQRTPMTIYTGGEAEGMTLELLLDGYANGTSVEPACRTVELMAGAFSRTDPAKLIVSGPAIPHGAENASQNRWRISGQPDWGDKIRNEEGDRVRQYVNLALLLVVESDALERIRPRTAAPSYRLAVAKQGDDFNKIAKRELGTKRLAQKLRRLNVEQGVAYFKRWGRSVDKTIREGTQVRLPTANLLKQWTADLKAGK